jgi:hypothetical protein
MSKARSSALSSAGCAKFSRLSAPTDPFVGGQVDVGQAAQRDVVEPADFDVGATADAIGGPLLDLETRHSRSA